MANPFFPITRYIWLGLFQYKSWLGDFPPCQFSLWTLQCMFRFLKDFTVSLQGRYDTFLEQQGCCLRKGYISLNRWAATVKLQPQARPCTLQKCFESFPDYPLFPVQQNTLVISGFRFPLDLWLSQLQNLPHGPILMCAKSCTLIWPVSAQSNSRPPYLLLMPLSWELLLFSKGPQTFMMWWRGVQAIWKAPMMVR